MKFCPCRCIFGDVLVALFARAWIEIVYLDLCIKFTRSPSLRGRGLKFAPIDCMVYLQSSPSLRGRGLKYLLNKQFTLAIKVALFARAWIEITKGVNHNLVIYVALFARAWIEISDRLGICKRHYKVALFARAWIEIIGTALASASRDVALFARAWIEIKSSELLSPSPDVALFARAWIEIALINRIAEVKIVALFARAWIEIFRQRYPPHRNWSPSLRGRGLK